MNKEATIIRSKLKEMLSEDNAFSVDLENGGRAFIKPKEDVVNIVDINAPKIDAITPKRGTKTYEHVLKKVLEMGYNTVRIRLQSKDSRNAIKKLVDKNILLNPREEVGLSIDRYPTVFDINADAVKQELKNINEMRDHIKQILREQLLNNDCDCCKYFDMNSVYEYDSMEKPLYSIFKNGYEAELKFMRPQQYLKMVRSNFQLTHGDMTDEELDLAIDKERVKEYTNAMENGDKFPVGFYVVGKDNQEGRHRALATDRLGCEEIPVVVIKPIEEEEIKEYLDKYSTYSFEELNDLFKSKGYEKGISGVGYRELERRTQHN